MKHIYSYTKDYYGGALMILIGLFAIVQGISYKVGSLRMMGSGFFPVALGALMALTGVAIAFSARRAPGEKEKARPPEWRGWICITLSIVAFIALGKHGGLVPSTFAIVFISALGDRKNSVINALVLALAMVVVCVVVFWWALQLPFPLFQWS